MKSEAIDVGIALGKLLTGATVLPQARLEELAARGVILSVMTFEDFMDPKVHWIEPEEFGRAFDELIVKEGDMAGKEAAFTEGSGVYPGFINAKLDGDEMIVTLRAPQKPGKVGELVPTEKNPLGQGFGSMGSMARLAIPLADWDEFVAQAQRVRAGTAD